MYEYSIQKTETAGGTVSAETTVFGFEKRRVMLSIQVIGAGSLYCSIGPDAAVAGRGIFIDADNPLLIETPITGEVHVINDGSVGVDYVAAEGLL
jgi:hypothetical protein